MHGLMMTDKVKRLVIPLTGPFNNYQLKTSVVDISQMVMSHISVMKRVTADQNTVTTRTFDNLISVVDFSR